MLRTGLSERGRLGGARLIRPVDRVIRPPILPKIPVAVDPIIIRPPINLLPLPDGAWKQRQEELRRHELVPIIKLKPSPIPKPSILPVTTQEKVVSGIGKALPWILGAGLLFL